jgi:hypothetical protein
MLAESPRAALENAPGFGNTPVIAGVCDRVPRARQMPTGDDIVSLARQAQAGLQAGMVASIQALNHGINAFARVGAAGVA